MSSAFTVFIFRVSVLVVAVVECHLLSATVIACWENGDAFIFYVGFGTLIPFLFKACVGGTFYNDCISVRLTFYDGFIISPAKC